MTVRIINADVMDGLKELRDGSVHACVTSPPYFNLRSYLPEDHPDKDKEIGREQSPDEFIDRMVAVFREVKRVLREDGTLWVNIGDTYNNADKWGGGGTNTGKHSKDANGKVPSWQGVRRKWKGVEGCKPKDLIGIPWMLAFALRADGWWLRQDIIWHKPNPMPESVTDRCTKAHEYIFMLTKSARYFYDADAIKEGATYLGPNGAQSSPYAQGFGRRTAEEEQKRRARKSGNKSHKYVDQYESDPGELHRTKAGLMKVAETEWLSRNKRSVWSIATQPFPEAHFATFPPELAETCIKAGCPKGGTVLDPFGGAGTTGLVADRLQRDAVLIELNPEYAAMAERRINGDRGGLLDLMEAAE